MHTMEFYADNFLMSLCSNMERQILLVTSESYGTE